MKKVLFVATVVKQHIMVFHIPYLKLFKENGYEVHVCAKNDYEDKDDCEIPYCDKLYDLPFERSPFKKNNLYVLKKLKNIIDNNKYDIIHCHTPIGGALTRLASIKARRNSSKIIYTAHGFHFYKGAPLLNWLVYYPVEKWLARYTDVLITINKEDYIRAKKFKAKKVQYIPGVGLDTKKFSGIVIDKSVKRRELSIPDGAFLILSVGELNKNKNHETVIKALAKLNNPNVYYVICGQGVLEEQLQGLIKELGLEEQVKLMGFRRDIAEICKASDVFAFPSKREGLGLAALEAMASGLPIVTSNIHGIVDYSKDGVTGFSCCPTDIDGFARALNKLIKNKELCKDFGKSNIDIVKKYDLDVVIEKMKDIYGGFRNE